ncbi:MAG: cob(I)yrinic acid a,c-diamide adenosyltransferase [Rikenellaceae bacterium]|jgi:cob(I)alamin adenosyltransferase|nr:cob(I)yrinic acid a,c-diamide adenosyltransferase [Rikenellaceae bacterium]
MKIYTKTGDRGTTTLVGGRRVAKHDPRVEAYGAVDELMAQAACLRDGMDGEALEEYKGDLLRVLGDLMTAGSIFATERESAPAVVNTLTGGTAFLEARIDCLQAELPPLRNFTLPGGHPLVSLAHVVRTVCRRAEREATKIDADTDEHWLAVGYLNRLSDYLYVLGRKISREFNIEELVWIPGK